MNRPIDAVKSTHCWHYACAHLACWIAICSGGCRSSAPIYVWQPAPFTCPDGSRVAIGTVGGDQDIAAQLEQALMRQRPSARADLALITPQQLKAVSPILLASTASLDNEALSMAAARIATADFLLLGDVLSSNLNQNSGVVTAEFDNINTTGNERLLTSWRLIDVHTSRAVATRAVSMNTAVADETYPDLVEAIPDASSRLVVASARETWRELAPSVQRDQVELMIPWLQLGAIPTRSGIVDAHQGRWDLAEQKWRLATRRNPLNIAARHNLAIAQAAREDFPGAKQMLEKVSWPLSTRLPAESRFWLDQRHRQYHAAHGLGKPQLGWSFPDPPQLDHQELATSAEPVNIDELPWWTAIPFAKPPGWRWRDWLLQPLVL